RELVWMCGSLVRELLDGERAAILGIVRADEYRGAYGETVQHRNGVPDASVGVVEGDVEQSPAPGGDVGSRSRAVAAREHEPQLPLECPRAHGEEVVPVVGYRVVAEDDRVEAVGHGRPPEGTSASTVRSAASTVRIRPKSWERSKSGRGASASRRSSSAGLK